MINNKEEIDVDKKRKESDTLSKISEHSEENETLITDTIKRRCKNPMMHKHSIDDENILQYGSRLFDVERDSVETGHSRKFNCNTYLYKVNYSSDVTKSFGELTSEFNTLFTKLHTDMINLVSGKDKIRVLIEHSSFDRPISFNFMDKDEFFKINLQDSFFNVIQSYREIPLSSNDPLKINVCLARLPNGGKNKRNVYNSIESFRNSPCITKVQNNDKLCAIYAVIISIAQYEMNHLRRNNHSEEKQKIYRNQLEKKNQKGVNMLKLEAKRFLDELKLDDNIKFGIEVFPMLQKFYKNEYQITVVNIILLLLFSSIN